MNQTSSHWNKPVHIVMQSGLARSFRHPYDALDFLEYEWPVRRCAAREQAVKWCARALEAKRFTALSRSAFQLAAHRAGMAPQTASAA